jgi:DNA-binding transcriptional ArsR family regulator
MRPLVHPSIEDVTVEGILHALSDPVRAAIYAQLAISSGATCSNFLKISDREIPKSTLSQHFRALREAGLIRSEEINQRFPGLVMTIMKAHQIQAAERMRGARRRSSAAKKPA